MEFYDVINRRRSIRSYKSDPIPADALKRIAEAVSLAPSACNLQPWTFRIVVNRALREKICACYKAEWLAQAPAIALAIGNRETCWKRLEGDPIISMDIGIVMEHFVLAAAAEGLGSCWICAYNVTQMNQAAGVAAPWSVYAVSPLGYAAAPPRQLIRKPLDEIFKVIE